jgi:hypothetical protein
VITTSTPDFSFKLSHIFWGFNSASDKRRNTRLAFLKSIKTKSTKFRTTEIGPFGRRGLKIILPGAGIHQNTKNLLNNFFSIFSSLAITTHICKFVFNINFSNIKQTANLLGGECQPRFLFEALGVL